jgi:hypothetical protein
MVELQWLRVSQNGLQAQPHVKMYSIGVPFQRVITGLKPYLPMIVSSMYDTSDVADLSAVVQPKRLVLDRQGRLPLTAKILNT